MADFFRIGFAEVLSFQNLLLVIFGVFLGTVVGAIPGLTATLAISLLIPLTFGMDAVPALVLLLGIYCGGIYGGSITAILINAPGTPGAAATLLDGHPMAKQGRAGEALGIATLSSALGGMLSAFVLIFLAQKIAFVALEFSGQEYFAISVFGLDVYKRQSRHPVRTAARPSPAACHPPFPACQSCSGRLRRQPTIPDKQENLCLTFRKRTIII